MKNNILNAVAAVLLTALIVAGGMLAPKLTLESRKSDFQTKCGAVTAKSLTPYGNDRRSLTERISSLSKLVDTITGKTTDEDYPIAKDDRQALETEFSEEDAVNAASKLLSELCLTCNENGIYVSNNYTFSTDYSDDTYTSATSSSEDVTAVLLTSENDTALSIWSVYFDCGYICLDALSGLPLYISLNCDDFSSILQTDESRDAIWELSAKTLSSLYADQLTFSLKPQRVYYLDKNNEIGYTGKSDGLIMDVRTNVDPYDQFNSFNIQISA